jgi:type VI secretion system secreted protein Hcp
MAVADFFLKIEADGMVTETQDSKHKGEIELLSWSWGVQNSGSHATGSGGGSGKCSMQDFHFVMNVNKATPKLMLACANGEHIKKATLTCRKAGKEQQEYMIIKFSDLLISSYQTGASNGSPTLTEQVSFNFAKIEFEYKEQKKDGGLGGTIKAHYDLAINKGG